ncbi:MAG: hypothetical protein ACRC35_03670 [Angustibacter sp.]
MGLYIVVGVISVVLLPVAWRRSGSMTRYVTMTGAPVVWVLLAATAVVSATAEVADAPSLGRGLFTGGLIGTAFVQVLLVRRGLREPGGPLHDPSQPDPRSDEG